MESTLQTDSFLKSCCAGRLWFVRVPLLVWFVFIGVRHAADPLYGSLMAPLNLVIHEAGHLFFSGGGEWLSIAGGTLLQLAVPLGVALTFLFRGDLFAVAFCGIWEATGLYGVATYLEDARKLELPLVSIGGGDEVIHDWVFLLDRADLLLQAEPIARGVRIAAFGVHWTSFLAACAVIGLMIRYARDPAGSPDALAEM